MSTDTTFFTNEPNSKIVDSNPFYNSLYNLSNIKKSNAHQVTEKYLDQETALQEYEDICENYQLYRIKDQILEIQKTTLSREHDAYTIRSTAKLIDLIADEIFTKHDLK